MSKHQRSVEKERFWREIIERQSASGLSVRAFCQQEKLAESAFYAWRRTLHERDAETASPAFVPVVVAEESTACTTPSGVPITVELPGGLVVRLPVSTPAAWLAEFVHTFESGATR